MIDNTTKQTIIQELSNYCVNAGSANKAQASLRISGATISKMLNDKHGDIADDMWRKMANALGIKLDEQWIHADTEPTKALSEIFNDSRKYAETYGIICQPGGGKTHTLNNFRKQNENVFYVKCKRHTSESEMLQELLRSMGKNHTMRSINALLNEVVRIIERLESPVIIIDELEKVPNNTLFNIIDLYNEVEDKCGICLIGTPNLKKRIVDGLQRTKMCYNELYSRLGGRFAEIPSPSRADGAAVLRANGITDLFEINTILNDSCTVDENSIDMRRIKRLVHKENLLKGK